MKPKSFFLFFLVMAMLLGNVPLVFAEEVESTEVVSAEEVADSVYDITEDVDIIEGSEESEEKEVVNEEVVESEPVIETREPLLFEIAVPLNFSFSPDGRALTAADSVDNLTGLDLMFKGLCVSPCNEWFLEGAEVDFANYRANKKGFRFSFNDEVIETTGSIVNPFDSVELLDGESFDFLIAIELGPWDETFTEGIFTLTLYFEEVIKEKPIETLPPVPTEAPIETLPPVPTEMPVVEPTETPIQPSPVEPSEPTEKPTEGIEIPSEEVKEPTDPPKEESKDESIEKPTEEPSETEEPKEEPVEEPTDEPIEEPTEEEKDSEGIEEPEPDAEPKEELPAPSEDSSEEVPKSEEGFLEEPQEKFEVDKKLEEIEGTEEKVNLVVEEVSSAESILAPTDLTEFS